jgi:PAS domain S-box-containing protein
MTERSLNSDNMYTSMLLSCLGDAIISTDLEGKIVYMNSAAEYVTGWKVEEAFGEHFSLVLSLVNVDNNIDVRNIIEHTLKTNNKVGLEKNTMLVTKGGLKKYISATCTPLRAEAGELVGVVVAFRDINSIRSSELATENEDQKLKRILNSAPIGMITLDDTREICEVNQAALEIMEKPNKMVAGNKIGDAIGCKGSKIDRNECGTSVECTLCSLRIATDEAFESDKYTRDIEFNKVIVRNGKELSYWFRASITPLYIKGKRNVIVSIMDITDRKNKEIAITKSRDFCMNVIDHLPDLVWSTNLNMEYDFVNKGFLDFTGIKIENALGNGWKDIIHSEDIEEYINIYSEAFKKRDTFKASIRLRRKDGEYRWCTSRGGPYYDLEGQFIGYVGKIYDVTEKRIGDEALNRYKLLSQHAKDLILFVDTNGQIIEANEAAVKAYGYTQEELLNLTVFDLRRRDDVAIGQLYEAGIKGITFEAVHFRKNGSSFPVEVSSKSTIIDGKKVILSIIRNISERKEAEKEVLESQRRYDSLFMNMNAAFAYHKLIFDEAENVIDFEYLQVNSTFEAYFGRNKDVLIGKRFTDVFPTEKGRYDKSGFYKVALTGKSEFVESYFSNITQRWYSVAVYSPEKNCFAVIFTDIHDRKMSELELKKAKEDAEAASKAKSEFLANMSHEIRTPLNGMLGMIDLTMLSQITIEQHENLSTAKLCANQLLNIINDILDFSKLEAGKLSIQNSNFDIKALVEETIKIHALKAADKGLELNYQFAYSVPQYLFGDPHRLQQILNNLISNAIKFTERGEILVTIKIDKNCKNKLGLLFSVSDTGMGIDAEEKNKLFKSFSQLNSTITKKHGGTGLGLVISKQLVEMMGGSIWLESEKGKGSIFYFTSCFEDGQALSIKSKDIDANPNTEYLKILLAEDDSVNQRVLIKLLKERGYSVELATNGQEAVAMYIAKKYDVVLMDIQMPEMDGIEATKMIREIESHYNSHIPIIALTAFALDGDRERFIAIGMDDYLSKPIKMEELYQKLDNIKAVEMTQSFIDRVTFKNSGQLIFEKKDSLLANDKMKISINEISDLLTTLEQAVDNNNISQIEKLSHKIKEHANSIDAYELKNSAFKVELAARRGSVEETMLSILQLRYEFETFKKPIDNQGGA